MQVKVAKRQSHQHGALQWWLLTRSDKKNDSDDNDEGDDVDNGEDHDNEIDGDNNDKGDNIQQHCCCHIVLHLWDTSEN